MSAAFQKHPVFAELYSVALRRSATAGCAVTTVGFWSIRAKTEQISGQTKIANRTESIGGSVWLFLNFGLVWFKPRLHFLSEGKFRSEPNQI